MAAEKAAWCGDFDDKALASWILAWGPQSTGNNFRQLLYKDHRETGPIK